MGGSLAADACMCDRLVVWKSGPANSSQIQSMRNNMCNALVDLAHL